MSVGVELALGAATERAQVAMVNFVRMLAASGISRAELPLILPSAWPAPLKKAFSTVEAEVLAVAMLLALKEGVERWDAVPAQQRQKYVVAAHERAMDSPAPEVGHASGVAPFLL